MPIREYDCANCGRFEVIQKQGEDLSHCPTCSGVVERMISAAAFTFGTTGFYSTDYKPRPKETEKKD